MNFDMIIASFAVLLSSIISSTVGFAFAPIAGVFLFYVPIEHTKVIEILLVASISVQGYSILYLSRNIPFRRLGWFLAGGILAMPAGLALLLNLDPLKYRTIMGIWLVLYSLYALLAPQVKVATSSRIADAAFGALGGITGPLAAFPGAFVVIWCNLQELDPLDQRAIYQPYILTMQLMTLSALFVLGKPHLIRLDDGLFALQALIGAVIGLKIFSRLKSRTFKTAVNGFLLFSGLSIAVEALR